MNPINSYSLMYQKLKDTCDQVAPRRFPLHKLPISVIEQIADFSFAPTDAASLLSLKALSKDFRDLDLTFTRKRQWEALLTAPVFGIVDIPSEMRHIERTYVHNPLNSTNRYIQYFRRLTSVFRLLGARVDRGEPLKTSPADYISLQNSLENVQLQKCWPEMKEAISYSFGCSAIFYKVPHDDADAESIRSFLGKESIKRLILSVRSLRLTNRDLVSLPKEITLFSSLRQLVLSSNQFLSLPSHAFVKRIRDPVTPYVFNEVPAFPYLQRLHRCSYNIFSGSSFREVRAVPSLNVFPMLTQLVLGMQALTSLSSIEGIEEIRQDGRTSRQRLLIHLIGSKVNEYMMDSGYRLGFVGINYNTIYHLRSYTPISPLGQLYHTMLYTEAMMFELEGLVDLLPDGDKNLLYYSIWKHSSHRWKSSKAIDWGRSHCFTDEHLFRKCIGLSILEKFMQIRHIDRDMTLGLVNRVYQNLWDQYRHRMPVFEQEWASQNIFKDFARLADSMSAIDVNSIKEINFYPLLQVW
ncbi:MAG: hypothetical protein NTX49_04725 [Chlamydiae bacterium]|nr:hypothetical protein [Chlamydiota bacterium]